MVHLEFKYGTVNRTLNFDVADPQQAAQVELYEVTKPIGNNDDVQWDAVDWVDVAEPLSLKAVPTESLELAVDKGNRRLFVAQTKLTDQRTVFGGLGKLTVGPHGVVDIEAASFAPYCAYPFACGLFELKTHAEGDGKLTIFQPTGPITELYLHAHALGATP
jgi:hypothetical protein